MKKYFLLVLLGIVAMLPSCNKEEVGGLATNKTASFNVSVGGGVKTRAKVDDLTRYVMEVYKGDAATGTPEVHKEQAEGVFTDVVLDNAQQYTVLFWADYGTPNADGTNNADNEYNAADLKAARVADGKQPTKAAYSGVSKFTVGTTDESVYTNVALTHAVSQVSFVQTEDLTSATNELVVSYPESYSLNVADNAVTKIDRVITHSFTYNQKAKGTLGTSYIIAATGAPKTVLEITATLNSETAIAVSNVPFERNFRTNISGAYSSKYEATLKVTCDDTWTTPDNEVEFGKVYKLGDIYPNATAPIGVVFWVDETDATYNATDKTSAKGKIVSLDEATSTAWSTENIDTSATDNNDGAANTSEVFALNSYTAETYPAFAWCAAKNTTVPAGISWYIPAIKEIEEGVFANKATLNTSLTAAGATELSGNTYWSSTQNSDEHAWYIYFSGGDLSPATKNYAIRVRVVSAF